MGPESENGPRRVFLDAATGWADLVQNGVVSCQEGVAFNTLSDTAEMGLTAILIGSMAEVVQAANPAWRQPRGQPGPCA